MSDSSNRYINPTDAAGAALFSRDIPGAVVMLNLMRFREIADYSEYPELAPSAPITGAEAYQKYMAHTAPLLKKSGGEVLFLGTGANFFIGPDDETWHMTMLVRQRSLADFRAFSEDPDFLAGFGHRAAALEDSRLLPLVEYSFRE